MKPIIEWLLIGAIFAVVGAAAAWIGEQKRSTKQVAPMFEE